jgi:DNA-binding NtrC family response regulator
MTSAREAVGTATMLGQSSAFHHLRNRISQVARARRTTLICGPTGSGKDLIAHLLHDSSDRHDRPFVAVHCAALPEALVEAEMFGHARGAFTGATQTRSGLVRTASHGTLFLDEIDSLPASAQAKLLRFLETGEYRAVGSDRVEYSDAWVIAATNQNLNERVRTGLFRADLMFRLAVVKLEVPPLCERRADILFLAEHFLEIASHGSKRFADEARMAMLSHDWPGNVRELKHRVEAAALLCEGDMIDRAALDLTAAPAEIESGSEHPLEDAPVVEVAPPRPIPRPSDDDPLANQLWRMIDAEGMTLAQAVARCESMLIQSALRAESNNRTRAAERLGIHVRTIFKKLIDRAHASVHK